MTATQERDANVRQLLDTLGLNSGDHDNSVRRALAELVDMREEVAEIADFLGGDTDCYDSLEDHVRSVVGNLRDALQRIAKKEGRYSRDPMTFAENTIEDMARIASEALEAAAPQSAVPTTPSPSADAPQRITTNG